MKSMTMVASALCLVGALGLSGCAQEAQGMSKCQSGKCQSGKCDMGKKATAKCQGGKCGAK